ncbi:MAG: hypothetical protein N4A48_05790, partial [Tepidibacter sp.]|uniref:hypothetical protein n=1 Tax=Tepidibacter sp. TaxID=2529387 RepID=UPI0025E4BD37
VANGTIVSALKAALASDNNAEIKVLTATGQTTEATVTDAVTNTMVVLVTAENGVEKQEYTITVNAVLSDNTDIKVATGKDAVVTEVKNDNHTMKVANGTTVSALKTALASDNNAEIKVLTATGQTTEATVTDAVTNTMVVLVIAENGVEKQEYTITVNA